MGRIFYSNCQNNAGVAFAGTDTNDQCLNSQNLGSLPMGASSFVVEFNDSGTCLWEPSWIQECFAFQSSPPNLYYFILAWCSSWISFSPVAPWVMASVATERYNYYMFTLPFSFKAVIDNIYMGENLQIQINWTVNPLPKMGKSGAQPKPAPFSVVMSTDESKRPVKPKKGKKRING